MVNNPKRNRFRVALIGCGYVARSHLVPLLQNRSAEVVAVADAVPGRAEEVALRYNIAEAYGETTRMLQECCPDAVHVLTPPPTHSDLSLRALNAGCHVLVEKPLALSAGESDEMMAAARRAGLTLGTVHNYLFEPAVAKALAMARRGELGDVVSTEVSMGYSGSAERAEGSRWIEDLPGGRVHEVGVHVMYLLRGFLGEACVVSAWADPELGELAVIVEGQRGHGVGRVSCRTYPVQRFINVYGTRKTLRIDLLTDTLVSLTQQKGGIVSRALRNLSLSYQIAAGTVRKALATVAEYPRLGAGVTMRGHTGVIDQFYRALRHESSCLVTAEEGRETVRMLDEVWDLLGVGEQGELRAHPDPSWD